jgi:hypothetical protein
MVNTRNGRGYIVMDSIAIKREIKVMSNFMSLNATAWME